ncbi:MAG: type III-A CRISPR-associated RAMP protein Csm5 [Clostridiales Family XIII bacterium]|jgi:CRISPR-associated protein Csm5|nr:type III-A CRISPR-associated RAMP protein Csm5 [Clostridiales Family XIII bacterium]
MNEHLKRFRVIVKALAPVHIGSGDEIGKKEYILCGENEIYFPNVAKMYGYFSKKGKAEEFERFLLNDGRDLRDWLRKNDIRRDEWNWGGYRLSRPAPQSDKRGVPVRFNEIKTFVKDPYGLPYIPGSSLKGALRNVIIGEMILRDKSGAFSKRKAELTQLRGNDLRRNSREIAKAHNEIVRRALFKLGRDARDFGKATNDAMAAVRIGDSKPLRLSDLTICEKIDSHILAEKGERPLPTFRECLKPGVSAEFSLTVDVGMLEAGTGGSGAAVAEGGFQHFFCPSRGFKRKEDGAILFEGSHLQNAVRKFNILYDDGFRKKFEFDADAANVIFLGGGSGFLTKTVLLALFWGDDKGRVDFVSRYMERAFPQNHKHDSDRTWGVSPHTAKLTEYDGARYEMGKCEMRIVPLKD